MPNQLGSLPARSALLRRGKERTRHLHMPKAHDKTPARYDQAAKKKRKPEQQAFGGLPAVDGRRGRMTSTK